MHDIISITDEEHFENSIIELFQNLGYTYLEGANIGRDYHDPLFREELEISLARINNNLPQTAIDEAIYKLYNIETGSLEQKNATFTNYLQNGVSVNYQDDNNEEISSIIYLVDYENVDNNSFYVINQWSVEDKSVKRPDVVIFVNGLPLIVIELKSPSREETDVSEAYRQLRNYMKEIPSLFIYNAFCVMSDHATSKAGTITADEDRFMEWKTTDGNKENTQYAAFDVLFEGMFEKSRFLDILKDFIVFSHDGEKHMKILAAYHQFFAVKKAVESTVSSIGNDRKAGVFWHTQGSGKSLSMVFYVKKLQERLESPTFVVITDRNDLDEQLFGQFVKSSDFLRQNPRKAISRANLNDLLNDRQANGIFFSTIQKFEESNKPLTDRNDIIVISDEAHRSQYGLDEKVDPDTGKITIGSARKVRDSLPNATFIGFTGTPISSKDKSTRAVFGNYIDVYDMTQSVEDGATIPIHYESRVIELQLDEDVLHKIDAEYDIMSANAEPYAIEKSKKELSRMESLLGAPETIDSLCNDIINHYEDGRDTAVAGKAMIVAYSRNIAMKIYEKILKLRPNWTDKLNVVMTSSNNDPEEWNELIGNKSHKKELDKRFKNVNDPFKIAIVVDMWLTGFDVPSLDTMYIFKPMKGHTLMQAIARVNRVFKNKNGGLVVDYIGISSALKQAMNDYTDQDQKNYGNMDIAKVAKPKFEEKLEVCRDLLHGYDYSLFFSGTDLDRSKTITCGVNFLANPSRKEKKNNFIKEAKLIKDALSLSRSIVGEKERFEAAYFEAVRTILTRVTGDGKISPKEINSRINELLKQSIKSEGVINLFSSSEEEFSLFDSDFLDDISRMKEKNLAIEMLKKLLNEQVSIYGTTNLVKSEVFSESLKKTMNNYINGMLTNEEVIEELLTIAKEIRDEKEKGNELGLTDEELAFYDALTKPKALTDFYKNHELIDLTRELTESLRKNRTIDWQKKEGARAKMRSTIKRLLKKYKYPPEGYDDAIGTVISQCELWVDNDIVN